MVKNVKSLLDLRIKRPFRPFCIRLCSVAPRAWLTGLAVGVLAVLVLTLGWLQYVWLGQVSDAELTRARTEVKRLADAAARKVDGEVARAFLSFMISTDGDVLPELAAHWDKWQKTAPYPKLIERVYFAPQEGDVVGDLGFFDRATQVLRPVPWPPLLLRMRSWLNTTLQQLGPVLRVTDLASGRASAIMVPTFEAAGPAAEPARPPRGFVVLAFDRTAIRNQVISDAITASFSDVAAEYRTSVWSSEERAGVVMQPPPVYIAEVFKLRFEHLDPAIVAATGVRPPPNVLFDPRGVQGRGPGWGIVVHRDGASLEQTVARLRVRNVVVAFAILLLLGLTGILLAVQARRARILADQSRHLMASVSHELRTPLAVIRSAADNLADGVVSDPPQVQQYGRTMSQHARRLADLVDRVLQTASADQLILGTTQVVDPIDLVQNALSSHAEQLTQQGFEVDSQLDPETPAVQGDPDALRRAVENLIDNALKHAREGRYLQLRVDRVKDNSGQIEIAVADRGPGLDRRERTSFFTPFFRGKRARDRRVSGVGLGLSLVRQIARAHGGDVDTRNLSTGGAEFRLLLPIKGAP